MTLCEHQRIILEIHQAKTLNSGSPQIKFILHRGIVTCPCNYHFQALPSSTTMPHWTWHQAHNQALVKAKDITVMDHRGKHMISPKEVMVDLKCSPLSNSQDMGRHLQMHLEWLQHRLESIPLFGRRLPSLLRQDNFPAHQGGPPVASQRNDFCWLRNHVGLMLREFRIGLHC